jgi:hypothetical protein
MIETKKYKSADEFLKDISYGGKMYQKLDPGFVYRGLQSGSYELLPSILRHGLDIESRIEENVCRIIVKNNTGGLTQSEFLRRTLEFLNLSNFFDCCDVNGLRLPDVDRIREKLYYDSNVLPSQLYTEEWIPKDLWELTALAQHYGLETRLLDWTQDIDIAIYFAVHCEPDLSEDKEKEEDSQYVVIWALNTSVAPKIPSLKIIRPPYSGNPNLAAQKGLFTYWKEKGLPLASKEINMEIIERETVTKPLNELIKEQTQMNEDSEVYMWRYLIPRKDRAVLYEYLKRRNVTAATLFPGYDGVVRSLKEDITKKK